jgi:hypothetical protein
MHADLGRACALLERAIAVAVGLAVGGLYVLAYWALGGGVR